jgi:hemerythrin
MKRNAGLRSFLENSWLFGEMVSSPVQNALLRELEIEERRAGEWVTPEGSPALILVNKGEIEVSVGEQPIATIGTGGVFGSEIVVFGKARKFRGKTTKRSILWRVPADALSSIPVVQWKLLEIYEQRLRAADHLRA